MAQSRQRRQSGPVGRRAQSTPGLASYWERAQWPLQSLYFLLPLLIIYELGTVVYAPRGAERLPAIVAESLLVRFFEMFGVAGVYLPGLLVVVVLLVWHFLRREPWTPEPKLYLAMLAEAAVLTAPLLVLSVALSRSVETPPGPAALNLGSLPPLASALPGSGASDFGWQENVLFSIGAGIYEELLFRLIVIALLHMLIVDLLGMSERLGAVVAVLGSAGLFAWYHFSPQNTFAWGKMIFYTSAGVYFAGIYVLRGFGIVAVVHALYDVVVLTQAHLSE